MNAPSIAEVFPGSKMLEQAPRILRQILAAATPEEMDWKPAPDRWSIAMVLAHLADVEENGFAKRFRAMLAEERPFLAAYNPAALFASGARFDGREQLEKLEQRRKENVAWLKTLPAEVGERTGQHEEMGMITFAELLNECAFHDLGHIRQVAEIYRARAFYPRMGSFQRYYKINP